MLPSAQIAAAASAFLPPLAHIGHWLWCFYLIPVLIVVGGILYTTRADKRRDKDRHKR